MKKKLIIILVITAIINCKSVLADSLKIIEVDNNEVLRVNKNKKYKINNDINCNWSKKAKTGNISIKNKKNTNIVTVTGIKEGKVVLIAKCNNKKLKKKIKVKAKNVNNKNINLKKNISAEKYVKNNYSKLSYNEFMNKVHGYNNSYGCDQSSFDKLYNSNYFMYYVKLAQTKYNMSQSTASIFLKKLNSIGACSYANVVNIIVQKYRNKPTEFRKKFGFNLYKWNNNKVYINDLEILMDIYYNCNLANNGGFLIIKNENGESILNSDSNVTEPISDIYSKFKFQTSLSNYQKMSINIINNRYLLSKNSNILNNQKIFYNSSFVNYNDFKNTEIIFNNNKIKFNKFIKRLKNYYKNNKTLSLTVAVQNNNSVLFKSLGSNYEDYKVFDMVHVVTITNVLEDRFIISSWGKKYSVEYVTLINSLNDDNGAFSVFVI